MPQQFQSQYSVILHPCKISYSGLVQIHQQQLAMHNLMQLNTSLSLIRDVWCQRQKRGSPIYFGQMPNLLVVCMQGCQANVVHHLTVLWVRQHGHMTCMSPGSEIIPDCRCYMKLIKLHMEGIIWGHEKASTFHIGRRNIS